ncbi:MAG: hypothetical protein AB1500_07145 [Bacillota bacterium]
MYRINLLPQELLADAAGKKRDVLLPGAIVLSGVLLTAYIILAVYNYIGYLHVNEKKTALQNLEPQIKHVESLESQTAKDKEQLGVLAGADSERRHYYSVLESVYSKLPVDMWLTRFTVSCLAPSEKTSGKQSDELKPEDFQKPTQLVIQGGTGSLASVGVYLNKLLEFPYLKTVTLKEVREIEVTPEQPSPTVQPEGDRPAVQQAAENVRVTVFTIEAVLAEGGWR